MNEALEINTLDASKKSTNESDTGISTPHDNDVLFGRGGNINIHPGNETFRKIVETKKRVYLTARFKREKRLIADSILTAIQSLRPPGRFLARDSRTGLWYDVGYEKARDKTSQALRENAPSIRKAIEDENDALRAEVKKNRAAEQYYATRHGQPPFYNEYHGENTMPSEYRQDNANNSNIPEVKSSSHYYHSTSHHENSFRHNDDDYNRPHSHPYETDYQFQMPTDQDYSMQRAKESRKASDSSRPTSAPNLDFDCSIGVWNDLKEKSGDLWDAAANIRPMCITSHAHGEEQGGFIPILSGDEDRKPKIKQNEACENEKRTPAPSSMFGCNAAEMFSSLKHLTSKGSDSLHNMDIEEFSVRQESNGSIGGRSLVNVFDGDTTKNRDTSEMSMMSLGDLMH